MLSRLHAAARDSNKRQQWGLLVCMPAFDSQLVCAPLVFIDLCIRGESVYDYRYIVFYLLALVLLTLPLSKTQRNVETTRI